MSGLAGVYNIPADDVELEEWTFVHMANHRDIIQAIRRQTGIELVEYVLDPLNLTAFEDWVYQHQIMHQQFNGVLGIQGFDLTEVNFADKSTLASWIQLNGNEHYQACNALGIG